jgi:kynurenine formamidase
VGREDRSELTGLVGAGRVFDLAQPLHAAMPQRATHPKFQFSLVRRHGDVVRESGLSTANELVLLCGHTGTHLDALSHASVRGRMHGRVSTKDAERHGGMRMLGVETVPPFARRFVLFDLATETGGPPLPAEQAITGLHLATLSGKTGLTPRRGDVALVRTGWGSLWNEPSRYEGHHEGIAGIDLSAAEWLAEHDVVAIGADNMTVEVEPKDAKDLPVHAFCLVDRGIYLIENLNLEALAAANAREGLFVGAPLRIVGATGGPIRPIALA